MDLREWRTARVKAIERRAEFTRCSTGARRLARHMIRSRDSLEGEGIFRSPRKLNKELGISESSVRRYLKELVEAGVFTKERRKDSRGTGRRDKTSAYHLRDELLPAALRCVTVTDLREAESADIPKANDTPPDRPADTPRRSTSYFSTKNWPLRASSLRDVELLGDAAYAEAPAAREDPDEAQAWEYRLALADEGQEQELVLDWVLDEDLRFAYEEESPVEESSVRPARGMVPLGLGQCFGVTPNAEARESLPSAVPQSSLSASVEATA